MPPQRDDFWRQLPNAILEQDQQRIEAEEWGAQNRARVAAEWGAATKAELQQEYMSLVPPVDTPSRPIVALGGERASTAPAWPIPDEETYRSQPAVRAQFQDLSQFGQDTLTAAEAYAACGPAAAVRLASIFGNAIPLKVALDAAKQVGWTPQGGMNGIGNQKRLLDSLGIPVSMDVAPATDKIISDAQTGNPVTVSTPKHYFTISGYDPGSGKFYVGSSGTDLRGGSDWLTLNDIRRLGGGINGALFVDAPNNVAPEPSVAKMEQSPIDSMISTVKQAVAPAAGGLVGAAQQAAVQLGVDPDIFVRQLQQESSFNPNAVSSAGARGVAQFMPGTARGVARQLGVSIEEFWADPALQLQGAARHMRDLLDRYGGDYSKALAAYNAGPSAVDEYGGIPPFKETQNYVNTILSSRGEITPPQEAFGGAVKQAQQAVESSAQQAQQVAQTVAQSISGAAGGAFQSFNQMVDQARQAAGFNEPYADYGNLGPSTAPGAGQVEAAGAFVGGTLEDLERQKREASPLLSLTPFGGASDVATAVTAGLERAGAPGYQQVGGEVGPFDIGPRELAGVAVGALTPGGPARAAGRLDDAASPLLQRTAQMLKAEPPRAEAGNIVDRFVRAATNRFESLDRFQEERLRGAGFDTLNPPEVLDASALVREMAGDAPAKIKADQELKPIIQSVGQNQDALSAYLMHRNNIDVARVLGERVEGQILSETLPAVAGTARLRSTKAAVQTRQRLLDQARNSGDATAIKNAQQRLDAATRSAATAQKNFDAALSRAETKRAARASAEGARVEAERAFPGGFSVADSRQALLDLEQHLGPNTFQRVKAAAAGINHYVDSLRQRMVQSGMIDAEFAATLKNEYPNWVPTHIIDYLDDPAAFQAGRKLSVADPGIRSYTLEGSEKFAEDPIASIVGLTRRVENRARKNELVNALLNLDVLSKPGAHMFRPRGADETPTRVEEVVSRLNNGELEQYIAEPLMAQIINGPQIQQAPGFIRSWTNFQRAVATVVNPTFALVRNPTLDIPEYMTRETARAGGNPLALPHIVSELARGYWEALLSPAALKALMKGELQGEAARYVKQAGGVGGLVEEAGAGFAGRREAVQQLTRGSVLEVKSIGDLQRILKDLVTLKPIAAIAERTELAPRIASMRLAEQRGKTGLRAGLAGRQVTIDFNEGGTLAKTINQFVPFFNAGIQGTAQIARMARENKAGAAAAVTMMVGLPAIAAESWNRSDPQRARDYADVPQYLKDQGVVIMLPGEAPVDAQGNRRPQFWWMNMRGFGPFAVMAREAYNRVVGNEPEEAQKLISAGIFGLFPVRASTIGDVPASVSETVIPGAATGLQLRSNYDLFRNRDIATKRNDELAGASAKAIAANLTAMAQQMNPRHEIRPSQVEFAIKELLGGVGATAMGAADWAMGAANRQQTPQDEPLTGGILRALGVRGDTGELFRETRAPEKKLPDSIQRIIQAGGVKYEPGAVPDEIRGFKLNQAEQTRFQEITNRRVAEILSDLDQYRPWVNGTPETRHALLERLTGRARDQARTEFLNTIPDEEWRRRRASAR